MWVKYQYKFLNIMKYIKIKTKHQRLCDEAKAKLRILMALKAHITERCKIQHPSFHPWQPQKEEQFMGKASREGK